MDAVQAQNLNVAAFLSDRFFAALDATYAFIKVVQATLLFTFWANVEKYEETIVYFQALLFITVLYRVTLDKRNSYFLLCFILLMVHMAFSYKYFFASVLVMTISSIICDSVDTFYYCMLMKSFTDVAVFILSGTNIRLLRTNMSSRCTDFLWLLFTMFYQLKYTIENYRFYTDDDFVLAPIFMLHIYVFYMKYYTSTYFCYAIHLTMIWMYLKSSLHPRRANLLIANVNRIFY